MTTMTDPIGRLYHVYHTFVITVNVEDCQEAECSEA